MSSRTQKMVTVRIAQMAVIFPIVQLFPNQGLWKYTVLGAAFGIYHLLASYADTLERSSDGRG